MHSMPSLFRPPALQSSPATASPASSCQLALPATVEPPHAEPGVQLMLPAPETALEKKSNDEMLEVVAPTVPEKPQRELKAQLSIEDKKEEPEKPKEPDAVEANQMLEQALQDRAQDKKDQQGQKEVMKKPAASKSVQKQQVLKRPAAKSTPFAKAAPVRKAGLKLKRPAAASEDKKGAIPSLDKRRQLRPQGCSRCRWVEGCCRSCWIGRGYHDN